MPFFKKNKKKEPKTAPIPLTSFQFTRKAKSFNLYPEHVFVFKPNEIEAWRIFKIMAEFVSGFEFINQYKKAASIFGSARCTPEDKSYQEAEKLGYKLAKGGFSVITGGGPGIMEAANKGASDAKGHSVGINIKLNDNVATEKKNPYVKESLLFDYFFVRKIMLSFASRVYIFCPGGFGTLDEFFEIITLIQTHKIQHIPIILMGKEFWTPLLFWIEEVIYNKNKAINEEDMKLYYLVDNADEAYKLISKLVK